MLNTMRYRLALDIGAKSIGWCLIRLDASEAPCAIIRMGSRIFPDGRNPKDGSSLAVTRRLARQMRRRRDRLLKRKARMVDALVRLGFWPTSADARRALSTLDPYVIRSEGLNRVLTPQEFGRAIFHLSQRRGFQSNRKTDKKDNDSGLLKSAIRALKLELESTGSRTVGEWLAKRHESGLGVRARLRGKTAKDKAYDLYIDRSMIAAEFDTLWAVQQKLAPAFLTDQKRDELRDILLFQRALKPVRPGRCTLLPDQERAPLALPSTQRFRIYQELNHLRWWSDHSGETPLTLEQRDSLVELLEIGDLTFTKIHKALQLPHGALFNLEDAKRDRLKGNATSKALASANRFGSAWGTFRQELQDDIVAQLLGQPSESVLVQWLCEHTGIDEDAAQRIADASLPEGYGSLSLAALSRVLPELKREVTTYAEAVKNAGFESHSALSLAQQTGEVLDALPYYGEVLQRHVGFADPAATDNDIPEKRFGRIANPTVHIGLNEVRKVVNALIARYGHPSEIIVEVARELKQGQEQRKRENELQAERQKQNDDFAQKIRSLGARENARISRDDLQRMRLWMELNPSDASNRCCPYTGEPISMARLFSAEVETEHILPFSMTLDDSLNNKTVALRRANRDKGNRTPFEAFGNSPSGYDYNQILARAALMPREKAKRFATDGYQRWLKDDKDFLARALTDTAYLSRIAREYLSTVCPPNRVRAIPGRLTALLRGKFGLNQMLSGNSEKNRNDHRHHALDAAVIAVTDQGLLQRFSQASASARAGQIERLVETMPLPWPSFREHVQRALDHIVVSHKPDHGHEGALHNDTAYGLRADGSVSHRVMLDSFKSCAELEKKTFADEDFRTWLIERTAGLAGKEFAAKLAEIQEETGIRRARILENLSVIGIRSSRNPDRHRVLEDGTPRAYKGYKGDSNYCIEISRNAKGKWESEVISTFEAYEIVRRQGLGRLKHPKLSQNGNPLVMRLMIGDSIKAEFKGSTRILQVRKIKSIGAIFVSENREANVREREDAKDETLVYGSFSASSLQKARGRQVTISVTGDVRDPGFSG